jgi:glycosyltransferase involved in cell wall biosynthesis
MTVSVIIPTRDYGRYIGEAIESLQHLMDVDWECVVVDDGSTDDTAEIVSALAASDGRIVYLAQAATGPSAARNAGLAATSGEFVQFLDADDLLGQCKLAHQLEMFARHPEADVVYGGARYFTEGLAGDREENSGRRWIDGPELRGVSGSGDSVLATLVDDNFMVVEAPLIRRSLFERIGGFDLRIRRMEDWECWLRCALAGAYFLRDDSSDADALPCVRVHRASGSQDQIAMHKAAMRVREGIEDKLEDPQLRRLNRRRIHDHWAVIGMLEGLGDHLGSGMRYLLKAGLAERRVKWVAWGLVMPLVRRPPGSWAMSRLRTSLARRRGEEVRVWHTYWP